MGRPKARLGPAARERCGPSSGGARPVPSSTRNGVRRRDSAYDGADQPARIRAGVGVEAVDSRGDVRRAAHRAGLLPAAVRLQPPRPDRLAGGDGDRGRDVPRSGGGGHPQADPVTQPLRGRCRPQAGGHRRPPPLLVLAREVPPAADLRAVRAGAAGALPGAVLLRRRQRSALAPVRRAAPDLPPRHPSPAGPGVRPAPAPVLRQLRHLLRAVSVLRGAPDPRLRARRCELGGQDQRRPRPGGGQGGDHARDHPLAIGRGVRAGGR